MKNRKRAPGAGRRPKDPEQGNRPMVSVRMRPALYDRLKREKETTGRQLTEIIETSLEEVFTDADPFRDQFGAEHVLALAAAVAKASSGIEARTGRKWTEDRFTFEAVKSAIVQFLDATAAENKLPTESTVPEPLTRYVQESFPGLQDYAKDMLTPKGLAFWSGYGQHVLVKSAEPLSPQVAAEAPRDYRSDMGRRLRAQHALHSRKGEKK